MPQVQLNIKHQRHFPEITVKVGYWCERDTHIYIIYTKLYFFSRDKPTWIVSNSENFGFLTNQRDVSADGKKKTKNGIDTYLLFIVDFFYLHKNHFFKKRNNFNHYSASLLWEQLIRCEWKCTNMQVISVYVWGYFWECKRVLWITLVLSYFCSWVCQIFFLEAPNC